MAENSTMARPYAQAAFELANAQTAMPKWSEMLAYMSAVVADARMKAAIGSPKLTKTALSTLVIDVCGSQLNDQAKNFVRLLVENGRLSLLADIVAQFELLRADAESTLNAEVVSAFDLTADQKSKVAAALKKRLGREVSVTVKTDATLLGGAIIRAGDLVIDGSAKGQLSKLANSLNG